VNSTEQGIEALIRAKGLTGPRVTPEQIDDLVAAAVKQYHHFAGTALTVCCLTLSSGYSVAGCSAAASPENFDAGLGQAIALADARDKLWSLEGYLLRDRLSHA
jgi:hypothetical protein